MADVVYFSDSNQEKPTLTFDVSDLYTLNSPARVRAVARLVEMGEPVIPVLATVLQNRSGMESHMLATAISARERIDKAREGAAQVLGQLGRPAVNALMKVLRTGDSYGRELAAQALHEIGDPAVVPLTRALQSLDVEVRTQAAAALAGLNAEKSVASLRKLLYEEIETRHHLRRRWLARVLEEVAVRALIGISAAFLFRGSSLGVFINWLAWVGLAASFVDTGAGLRRNTIFALSQTEDTCLVGAFALCLSDKDREVREAAAAALKQLLPRVRAGDQQHLTEAEMEAILKALDWDDRDLVIAVLQGLEQIGDARALSRVMLLAEGWEAAEIACAARECLPALQERARQARQAQTLLRASSSRDEKPDTLLRPAQSDGAGDTKELLRAQAG